MYSRDTAKLILLYFRLDNTGKTGTMVIELGIYCLRIGILLILEV